MIFRICIFVTVYLHLKGSHLNPMRFVYAKKQKILTTNHTKGTKNDVSKRKYIVFFVNFVVIAPAAK
jgi:hypothetical protein